MGSTDVAVVSDNGGNLVGRTVHVDNHVVTQMGVVTDTDRRDVRYSLAFAQQTLPRIVPPYQREEFSPRMASPETVAVGAMKDALETLGAWCWKHSTREEGSTTRSETTPKDSYIPPQRRSVPPSSRPCYRVPFPETCTSFQSSSGKLP